jgi:hypothetical protein
LEAVPILAYCNPTFGPGLSLIGPAPLLARMEKNWNQFRNRMRDQWQQKVNPIPGVYFFYGSELFCYAVEHF